jgi:hypothetical protein
VIDEGIFDDDPTPKKRQKTARVPVREEINANRKEHEPVESRKAEDKVGAASCYIYETN